MYNKLIVVLLIVGFTSVDCTRRPVIIKPNPPIGQTGELQPFEGQLLDNMVLDTDKDGLFDQLELDLGSDPRQQDSDEDGHSDRFEYYYSDFGFDLLVYSVDTDTDGLTDPFEEVQGSSANNVDTDGDGWSDFDEVVNARFGFNPIVPTTDSDFDGLADSFEQELGSSIYILDTDGDGATDFQEVTAGYNPIEFTERFGEGVGITYSRALRQAMVSMRNGGDFHR